MADYKRTSANLAVDNLPDEWSTDQVKAFFDRLETTGQPFAGTYEQALTHLETPATDGGAAPAGPSFMDLERLPTDDGAGPPSLHDLDTDDPEDVQKFNLWRALGSMARGAGPGTLGAIIGSPFGPLGSAIGTVAMALTEGGINTVNQIFGTNWKTPSEAMGELMTAAGVTEAKTQGEYLLGQAARVTTNVAAGGALAGTYAGGAGMSPSEFVPTIAARFSGPITPAARAAAQATTQVAGQAAMSPTYAQGAAGLVAPTLNRSAQIGEGVSEFGAAAGAGIAERAEMGPVGQTLMPMAGAMLSGGLTEGVLELRRLARSAIGFRDAQTPAPAGTRSPLSKTEIDPPTTMQGDSSQAFGEGLRRGSGEYRYRRFNENQQAVVSVLDDYGVPVDDLGNVPDYAVPLMDDFQRVRGAELDVRTAARDDVTNRLTAEGAAVNPERGVARLDELMEAEAALGASDSAQIGKVWQDLKSDITGAVFDDAGELMDDVNPRSLEQLQTIRKRFAARMKEQDMPDEMQQELRSVYQNIFGGYERDGTRIAGDVDDFILANGTQADLDQFLTANKRLHDMATEFDSKAMSGILDEWTKSDANIRPEVITDALFSHDASQVRHLYSNLSPEGQAVARRALISKFGETLDTTDMSPTLFARHVKEYGAQVGVFFDADQVKELTGMVQHFNTTSGSELFRRAAQGYQGLPTSSIPGSGTLQSMAVRQNPVTAGGASFIGIMGLGRLSRYVDQSPQILRMYRELADLTPGSESAIRLGRIISQALTDRIEATEQITE